MINIKTSDELNKYYDIINKLIDDYIIKNKIKPSSLKRYLKPGSDKFKKFLIKNNLSDVKNIEVILNDVIEDRYNMEKDGILQFESYKLYESDTFRIKSMSEALLKGINKANIEHEKVIADYYDTNLSEINIISSEDHQFKVNVWNSYNFVIIYSEEELSIIKENIKEFLYEEISNKTIDLNIDVTIKLLDLINKTNLEKQLDNILDENMVIKLITDYRSIYKFEKKYNNYYIWSN